MEIKKAETPDIISAGKPCILALEDGRTFRGLSFGADDSPNTAFGELVFNTSMYGYQEIMTDPSYAGQIVTFTSPEIGNYGTNDNDMESRQIYARGMVVRHLSRRHSSWRAQQSLDRFLKDHGILGISDVDTRAITKHIRSKGAMRCAITTDIGENLNESLEAAVQKALNGPKMEGQNLTGEVTCPEPYTMGEGKYTVAVLDFGIKKNILNMLSASGLKLNVYPARTSSAAILESKPDGIFLSNGPGDPAACAEIVAELKPLIDSNIPIFGICLGHQLLSIALGARTYKLKFGHRGGNQPVKNLITGKVEVTSQNHGFAVDENGFPDSLDVTHINLNDKSIEGFKHKHLPIFAVQYHPEASPGPHDSNYLFEQFFHLIDTTQLARV